jgi:hypothetical protein
LTKAVLILVDMVEPLSVVRMGGKYESGLSDDSSGHAFTLKKVRAGAAFKGLSRCPHKPENKKRPRHSSGVDKTNIGNISYIVKQIICSTLIYV